MERIPERENPVGQTNATEAHTGSLSGIDVRHEAERHGQMRDRRPRKILSVSQKIR